ncbi:MAG TPA: branched-chain amino acid ABC transporter permease [Stellaceae bacterium]|jgi:branched-chain amino acid transport system permease protein|nr:branched-chain amino acid ABC transporter permease [Stellaceae bacterium]
MAFILTYRPLFDLICIYSILAFSQYVALRAGLFSLATAGFASIGGYAGAILLKETALGPVLSAIGAMLCGVIAGLILSLPLARLRGAFQSIATIGFVQIMVSLTLYAQPLTGGPLGLNAIPKVATTAVLVPVLVLLTALLAVINRSGIGRAFDAIRQDYTVAMSLGISVRRYFRYAFALSGAIGALGGCLLAFNTYSIQPDVFGFPMLVLVIAAVILGGRSMVAGPLVGTAFLIVLPELIRPLADARLLLQGLLLILVIIFLPQGIVDSLSHHWKLRRVRQGIEDEKREQARELPSA